MDCNAAASAAIRVIGEKLLYAVSVIVLYDAHLV